MFNSIKFNAIIFDIMIFNIIIFYIIMFNIIKFNLVIFNLNQHYASDQATRVRLVTNCFQAMKAAASPGSTMTTNPELYLQKVGKG